MTLTNLTSAQLKHLLHLLQQKESIQAQLADINAKLGKFDGTSVIHPGHHRAEPAVSKRKELKGVILATLTAAGSTGLPIDEIARSAGIKKGSVSVWLYTTGKRVAGLKKLAPGRYAYDPSKE